MMSRLMLMVQAMTDDTKKYLSNPRAMKYMQYAGMLDRMAANPRKYGKTTGDEVKLIRDLRLDIVQQAEELQNLADGMNRRAAFAMGLHARAVARGNYEVESMARLDWVQEEADKAAVLAREYLDGPVLDWNPKTGYESHRDNVFRDLAVAKAWLALSAFHNPEQNNH